MFFYVVEVVQILVVWKSAIASWFAYLVPVLASVNVKIFFSPFSSMKEAQIVHQPLLLTLN